MEIKKLTNNIAVRFSMQHQMNLLALTSSTAGVGANNPYKKKWFQLNETNVCRMIFIGDHNA